MKIEPSSKINVYGGVEITKGHQLAFSSKANQDSYFTSKLKQAQVPCTMIKKTGRLRLDINGSIITNCNYISFLNSDFDNRTFYAIITDYDYINNECVEISYAVDFIQTYMFDVNFQDDCFIDREHLSQAKATLAATNPYDNTLWEFKTPETLAVGPEMEKPNYKIGGVNDDGSVLFTIPTGAANMASLIYFSQIDLDALDAEIEDPTKKPSTLFNAFLANVVTNGYGFYMKPGGAITAGSQLPQGVGLNNRFNTVNWIVCCHGTQAQDLIDMLTTWNAVSAIINIFSLYDYLLPYCFYGNDAVNTLITPPSIAPNTLKVKSPKLYTYPFAYMRIITPAGDVAEYQYEEFSDINTPQSDVQEAVFAATVDISASPIITVYPVNYKIEWGSTQWGANVDPIDIVRFDQVPTAPYSTDSFLAQTAAISAQIIQNNTADYRYNMEAQAWELVGQQYQAQAGVYRSGVKTAMSALTLNAGGTTQGFADSATAKTNLEINRINRDRFQNTLDMSDDAYEALAGNTDNAVSANYAHTRAAYVANKYTPSHGAGVDHYGIYGFLNIIYLRVQLRDDILKKYDKYFQNFGYASGRCGKPYIANFFNGSTDSNVLPSWTDEGTTYTKTTECIITDVPLPVSDFWTAMLATGVRWKNGDDLVG